MEITDLYRCADCQTAFCRTCIRIHFNDEKPENKKAIEDYTETLVSDFDVPLAASHPEPDTTRGESE